MQECKKTNYRLGIPGLSKILGLKKDKVVAKEIVDNACKNTEKVANMVLGTTWNNTDNTIFWVAKGTAATALRGAMKINPNIRGGVHLLNPATSKTL